MTGSDDISPDRIKAIDVFSSLSDEDLERAASLAKAREYDKDDELVAIDDWPADLLAIETGEVEVRRHGDVVAKLGAGDVVGERGVVRRAVRNADVVAVTPVKALFFHLNKVKTLRDDIPEIDERLRAIADERDG